MIDLRLIRENPEAVKAAVATTFTEAPIDEIVAAETPWPFHGVGQFYDRFTQTTDDEVIACLGGAGPPTGSGP